MVRGTLLTVPRPLRFRAPNPPAGFAGREHEIAWALRRLSEGTLVVLVGPGGIGKTSLALRTLADAGRARDGLFVAVRPGDPAEAVRRELLYALADRAGRSLDVPRLAGDAESAVSVAIDLADELGAWVVLDDLSHCADVSDAKEMLVQIAAFARRSRWLVTMRDRPRAEELDGRVLVVPGLDEADLVRAAAALAPEQPRDEHARAARLARGSPFLLKRALDGGESAIAETREALLVGLSAAAAELLERMSTLSLPLASESLAALAPGSSAADLDELVRRGLVVVEGRRFRAHDAARMQSGEDVPRTSARALLDAEDPLAWLESVRLFLATGDGGGAADALGARGDALLVRGEAPRLWGLLSARSEPALRLWKLRCASELGNATVLGAVTKPDVRAPADALEWARMLRLMGEPAAALDLARSLRASSADSAIAAAAAEIEIRSALALGRAAEAAELARASVARPALRDLAEAHGAADDGSGVPDASIEGVADTLDAARAAWWRGDRIRCRALVDRARESRRGSRSSLLLAREAMLLDARLAYDDGDLGRATDAVERVRPYARGPSLLRADLAVIDASCRLFLGNLDGLADDLRAEIELARRISVEPANEIARIAARVSELDGELLARSPAGPPWRRRVEARLDEATDALAAGDYPRALESAIAARRAAQTAAIVPLECEALAVELDARLVAGAADGDAIDALRLLARRTGSARFSAVVEYHGAVGDLATLERLASLEACAPDVARRAQAQLGASATLSAHDRAVIAAASAPLAGRRVETLHGESARRRWAPAWGIDGAAKRVWRPDGSTLDLSSKPLLLRILDLLFDHGGAADKETLVIGAWGESAYHPGRHDAKLYTAIRALRRELEPDPSDPSLLVTEGERYALGRPVRRVRARDHA